MGPTPSALTRDPMTNRITLLCALLLSLLLGGCARSASPSTSDPPASAAGEAEVAASSVVPTPGRDLAITMNASITVQRIDASLDQLRAAVESSGGFVADASVYGAEEHRTASVELRIPADRVGAVRELFATLGEVTSLTEKVEDVTEQRADLDARLRNARVEEKRLLEIVSTHSATVSDLLAAERELSRVRETIERLEAQERTLKGRIQLATIHVSLSTKSVAAWDAPGPSLTKAAKGGVVVAKAFFVYSGMTLVTVLPTALPIVATLFGIYLIVRRMRRRSLSAPA